MPLNPPTRAPLDVPDPGLRSIHYDARRAAKVALSIPAGDVVAVSDDVADQLLAESPQFKEVDPAAVPTILAARDSEDGANDAGDVDLVDMTKAELRTLADELGVDVPSGATKAELVDALADG